MSRSAQRLGFTHPLDLVMGDTPALLVASSEAGRGFRPSVAMSADSNALISAWRGHAQEAGSRERQAPAFGVCGALGRSRERRARRQKHVRWNR